MIDISVCRWVRGGVHPTGEHRARVILPCSSRGRYGVTDALCLECQCWSTVDLQRKHTGEDGAHFVFAFSPSLRRRSRSLQIPASAYRTARPTIQNAAAPARPTVQVKDQSGCGSVLVAKSKKPSHPRPRKHAAQYNTLPRRVVIFSPSQPRPRAVRRYAAPSSAVRPNLCLSDSQ